jgi:hypothetical protein
MLISAGLHKPLVSFSDSIEAARRYSTMGDAEPRVASVTNDASPVIAGD